MDIKLTSFSHGAGCGCKISPSVLDSILKQNISYANNGKILVGNDSKDDAAVYDLGDGKALISTTDFFMPIVDDPYDFGRIASANAISDVYAMGGTPILAIAILGWPINKIPAEVANEVIKGAREICNKAGIALAGGHSIDSPEPIFGLAVNGLVDIEQLKRNSTAKVGDHLLLTKKLGVGILTTAEKKGIVKETDALKAKESMISLNSIGKELAGIKGINAITDVTGFGLLGHLTEMCDGSGNSAVVFTDKIKYLSDDLDEYISAGSIPGGTIRNLDSYKHKIDTHDIDQTTIYKLADPQTSGGLLISVSPNDLLKVQHMLSENGLREFIEPIGKVVEKSFYSIDVQ